MHEVIMKKNYAKAFKIAAVLAALLALFSTIAVPLSLSQQIKELTMMEQTLQKQPTVHREHDELEREELWRGQITPLSITNYAILGGIAVLWLALLAYYWLLVIAWLYQSAVKEGMNQSLWPILGLFTNLLAVFAFLIIRDNPRRTKPKAEEPSA